MNPKKYTWKELSDRSKPSEANAGQEQKPDAAPEIRPISKSNEELNEAKPARRKRKQATEEQLNNPLHGVKLAQLLEQLVAHYGWEYLAMRVKIRCFMYNPTMKSSLGFLRKTQWAREHVEDIYLEMVEEQGK